MWTKVSVCATGREHVVPLNLRPGHREAESNMDWIGPFAHCPLNLKLKLRNPSAVRKWCEKPSGWAGPAEYDPKQLCGLQWVTCRDGSGTHRIKAGLFIIPSAVWRNISHPWASLEVRLLQGETNEAALVPLSRSQSEALLRVPAAFSHRRLISGLCFRRQSDTF